MVVLDTLRKQRNVADYSGDLVSPGVVNECIAHAQSLLTEVTKHLATSHPGLAD